MSKFTRHILATLLALLLSHATTGYADDATLQKTYATLWPQLTALVKSDPKWESAAKISKERLGKALALAIHFGQVTLQSGVTTEHLDLLRNYAEKLKPRHLSLTTDPPAKNGGTPASSERANLELRVRVRALGKMPSGQRALAYQLLKGDSGRRELLGQIVEDLTSKEFLEQVRAECPDKADPGYKDKVDALRKASERGVAIVEEMLKAGGSESLEKLCEHESRRLENRLEYKEFVTKVPTLSDNMLALELEALALRLKASESSRAGHRGISELAEQMKQLKSLHSAIVEERAKRTAPKVGRGK